MANQIVVSSGAKVRNLNDVIIGTSGVLSSLAFNVANGVPKLDVNGKILVSQLPNSVMEYQGTWNAATNTPTLVNGTGNQGDVYLCNVAGTVNFGAGPIAFFVGDQVIYSGSIWQRASGATGTVTSVAVTESGDSLNITGSPITTSGTINIGFNGTNLQYINGAGDLTTFPSLTGFVTSVSGTAPVVSSGGTTPAISMAAATTSVDGYLTAADFTTFNNKQNTITLTTTGTSGASTLIGATLNIPNYGSALTGYVPYTGATANVDLGTFNLTADVITGATGSFTSNGGSNTFSINHSSGAGIALNITKGGNGEGLYINKTSGSGNAATIIGTLNATTLVKSGGTSTQFLKADGSVDSSTYLTTSAASSTYVPYTGATANVDLGAFNFKANIVTIASAGGSNQLTSFANTNSLHSASAGLNVFGFNTSNNIYFGKGLTGGGLGNGGVFIWNNTQVRYYTLPDADGTIALTTDLGSYLPLAGGTLTGALIGTTALFSTSAQIGGSSYNLAKLNVQGVEGTYLLDLINGTEGNWKLRVYNDGSGLPNPKIVFKYGLFFDNTENSTINFYRGVTFSDGYLALSTAGVDRINISTGGFVGIGNSNITYKLDITGTLRNTTSAYFATSSGSVGIGTTSPSYTLDVLGTGRFSQKLSSTTGNDSTSFENTSATTGWVNLVRATSTGANGLLFIENSTGGNRAVGTSAYATGLCTYTSTALQFGTDNNIRMTISSAGNILLGTTDVPNGTSIYGSAFVPVSLGRVRLAMATSDAGNVQLVQFFNPNGQVGNISTNGLLTVYGTSSDYRLKKDVTPMENALSIVNLLKPYTWKWKDDSNGQGFIAHELQEYFPEAVTGKKDGLDEDGNPEYQSLDASFIVATLTKAIQELSAQNEELKARLDNAGL
jgi:hypothetical protein